MLEAATPKPNSRKGSVTIEEPMNPRDSALRKADSMKERTLDDNGDFQYSRFLQSLTILYDPSPSSTILTLPL